MTGLFKGLAYLHDEKNIIHRDLKPNNILIGSYKDLTKLKIIDFGLAIQNKKENIMDYEHCGTLLYQPPE
jgi:serine/threonine protein kinase